MSMIGTFNRVSASVKGMTMKFCPFLYINPAIAKALKIDDGHVSDVSVRNIVRKAGKTSGLALRIKELFSRNPDWINAWLIIEELAFGQFRVKDIYWRK